MKATGKVKCLEDKVEAQKGDLNMDGIQGIMHVFLEIGGEIVDNTYVHVEGK